MGSNNRMTSTLSVIVSEEKHVFLGNDVLLSIGVWIRNSDAHLIYSTETHERTNDAKSIFIGDHVWIGQDVMLLKGCQIASGSIIGAKSLLSGQKISSNTVWGGNPAKLISNEKFWIIAPKERGGAIHSFVSEDKIRYREYKDDDYIFEPDQINYLPFDMIDEHLTKCKTADKRLKYLMKISSIDAHNRFAF